MKKEKERRAAEETQRAMEQEAATLGLPRLIMIRGEQNVLFAQLRNRFLNVSLSQAKFVPEQFWLNAALQV